MPELNDLSEREREILRLVATGASNKEIAQKLVISANTVKVHLRNIFAKLETSSRTEATLWAVRSGLVQPFESPPAREEPAAAEEMAELAQPAQAAPGSRPRFALLALGALLVLALAAVGALAADQIRRGQATPTFQAQATSPVVTITRWQEKRSLDAPRSGHALAVYAEQIYLIGGEDGQGVTGSVLLYDPGADTWSALTSKPLPAADIQAAALGGRIYVPGGRLGDGSISDRLDIYDPLADTWTDGTRLPKPLSAYALATFEGRMFLFGGWDGEQYSRAVYAYNPEADGGGAWETLTPMPTGRAFAGAAGSGGKIFVMGGKNEAGTALNVNEIYTPALDDGSSDPWESGMPLPGGRHSMGVTSSADLLFVIGGLSDEPGRLPPLQFAPAAKIWQTVEAPLEEGWAGLGLVSIGTQLYAIGGQVDGEPTGQNLSYQAFFTIAVPLIP